MRDSEALLKYLQKGIDELLERGSFEGGQTFRKTQKEALEAYQRYLRDETLSLTERLKGFFEIPTGVGKTAVFVGIVGAAHKAAEQDGQELKTVIVVPNLPLLDQTLEAFQGNDESFNGFAPSIKGEIGLYGGTKKNLKKPLTIMTFDSWDLRLNDGTLNPDDIDILITDEAHRGTSENRIDLTSNFSNATTVKLAFTATAHFDDTKSVEQSHEREIYYKSVADAIREGELAAYISSQRYVIRVDPDEYMLSDEFQEASDQRRIAYRRAAKQNAWNKRMVKIFREGRDQKTGDLLSDNQAGFFVEGIRQADKLEDMLNADPVLSERAEVMGYSGVAVAIHSDLSEKEQERRFEAYKRGEYLAVIGDEKFKEGFDHPPMKTIFDCPHMSRVDKAQIIGRGLRKWWNEDKGRYEGLTVIDTVVYFGDEDSELQERNKNNALINTVSVASILEGVRVEGPDSPTGRKQPSGDGDGGVLLFDDDPDVEEYITFEEVFELEQEIEDLNKSYWQKNALKVSTIKETIEVFKKHNEGTNPNAGSGEIMHGPLSGARWNALDGAIRRSIDNPPEDEEYQAWLNTEPNPSLATFLIYLGYSTSREPLTLSDIKTTIDAYKEDNNGKNPNSGLGEIMHGPLKGKLKWVSLKNSVREGKNFLREDPEYQAWLKVEPNPNWTRLMHYLGYEEKSDPITMSDIRKTIKEFIDKNGKRPTQLSGEIECGPLKGRMKWDTLNKTIKTGQNGLLKDPAYKKWIDKESKPSLSKLTKEITALGNVAKDIKISKKRPKPRPGSANGM